MGIDSKVMFRWMAWFFFINIVLSVIVQATFLTVMPDLSSIAGVTTGNLVLAYFFLFVSYIAHATILNLVTGLVAFLLAWFWRRKSIIFSVSVLFALVLLAAQVIDRFAYRLYHSHQFAVGITILKSGVVGEEMPLSTLEYSFLGLVIFLLIAAECFIAWYIWRCLQKPRKHNKTGITIASILTFSVCVSYSLMAFVVTVPEKHRFNDVDSHLLLKMARLVPYYQVVYDWIIPDSDHNKRVWQSVVGTQVTIPTRQIDSLLNYPLHPLQCHPPAKKPNILFLVFDTLRYDALNPVVMPHMSQFAKQSVQFDNVYSGGNCTQPGIFSMFYGIPANYWQATLDQSRGPVLIKQLLKADYNVAIFPSASLLFPQFAKNVFVDVPHLRIATPGDTSVARDKKITQLFSQFVKTRDQSKPFFSFIFYDAVHNYCEGSSAEHMSPFHPAVDQCARFSLTENTNPLPYKNRYHNAAYFLDQQAEKVIMALKQAHQLDDTIIVVTADHGEQQNDQHMGYWSHASAYTPYQLHIPMLIYWPGMKPQKRDYFATNFDVVPTILQKVLGCKNPVSDYSVGVSLFDKHQPNYLVSGSYTDYAYVNHHQITRIYPGGDYTINGPLGHHLTGATLDIPFLIKGSNELSRYFK